MKDNKDNPNNLNNLNNSNNLDSLNNLNNLNTIWSYGVTTVPERLKTTLPKSLRSLKHAGFDKPRLFIDGADIVNTDQWRRFNLPISSRWPQVGAMKNWILSLTELYYREPKANLYAIFQDDIICSRNLKEYLEAFRLSSRCYLNLYTTDINQEIVILSGREIGVGWFESNQRGKGALGLVFTNEATRTIITSDYMTKKVLCDVRGHKNIDGAVIQVMRSISDPPFIEYCHSPSLIQHAGNGISTLKNDDKPLAPFFLGEEFDCMSLLDT